MGESQVASEEFQNGKSWRLFLYERQIKDLQDTEL